MHHAALLALALVQLLALTYLVEIEEWRAELYRFAAGTTVLTCCYAAALLLYAKQNSQTASALIFGSALIFRMVCHLGSVDQLGLLSSDLYRYLWEGQALAHGFNPYRFAPDSSALHTLQLQQHQLWTLVDHKPLPALYPPLSLLVFAGIGGSEVAYRVLLLLAESLTLLVLSRWLRHQSRPAGELLWYAWCPLPIIEIAMNAHLDGLFLPFLLSGLFLCGHSYSSANQAPVKLPLGLFFLTLATLVKQTAAVALCAAVAVSFKRGVTLRTLGRSALPSVALLLAALLPFALDGAFSGSATHFTEHWRFNGYGFYLIERALSYTPVLLPTTVAKLLVALLLLLCLLLWRHYPLEQLICILYLLVFLLSPVRYPWYALSYLVLVPLVPTLALQLLAVSTALLSLCSYEVWSHQYTWEVPPAVGWLQYVPLLVFAVHYSLARRRGSAMSRL